MGAAAPNDETGNFGFMPAYIGIGWQNTQKPHKDTQAYSCI